MKTYKEHSLTRTNKRSLTFNGLLLVDRSSKDHNSTRWVKTSIYETDKGKFVVGLGHITCWQGESDRYTAEVFETLEQVVAFIEENASVLAEDVASELNIVERI